MRVSVIVPSYRRPSSLEACLRSLWTSDRLPEEIVIAGRQGDSDTETTARELASLTPSSTEIRSVWVDVPGHIPPIEAASRVATGEIVVGIDDDITVPPGWLERLLGHFHRDSTIGVVGGRVIAPGQQPPILKGRPGRISWYGRLWGNVASQPGDHPLEVESVQECNWAWRRSLLLSLEIDPVLNFDDASMYGLEWCFQARKLGYRVIYDPAAAVYHHLAQRTSELDRDDRPRRAYSYCRNYSYIMLRHLPWWRKPAFLTWWFLIGERGGWGLAAIAGDAALKRRLCWNGEVTAAIKGKAEGIRLWSRKLVGQQHGRHC